MEKPPPSSENESEKEAQKEIAAAPPTGVTPPTNTEDLAKEGPKEAKEETPAATAAGAASATKTIEVTKGEIMANETLEEGFYKSYAESRKHFERGSSLMGLVDQSYCSQTIGRGVGLLAPA
ncbi:MAG: hypothetical protein ACR2H4_13385 [Pyrinomonadaceae bacterium]